MSSNVFSCTGYWKKWWFIHRFVEFDDNRFNQSKKRFWTEIIFIPLTVYSLTIEPVWVVQYFAARTFSLQVKNNSELINSYQRRKHKEDVMWFSEVAVKLCLTGCQATWQKEVCTDYFIGGKHWMFIPCTVCAVSFLLTQNQLELSCWNQRDLTGIFNKSVSTEIRFLQTNWIECLFRN